MLLKYQPRVAAAAVLLSAGMVNAQTAPLTQVEVTEMKLEDAVIRDELSGRTTAYQVAEVRPQVSGIIEKRLFEEGAEVKAGQSLYRIRLEAGAGEPHGCEGRRETFRQTRGDKRREPFVRRSGAGAVEGGGSERCRRKGRA